MQDIDITSTQSLIDRYYEEEKAQREMEQTLASITTRLDASDLAMLSIISKRFRKTREDVAQQVLSSALIDLFARVDAGERKLMARDADDSAKSIANEIAEENGVHSIEFKGGAWGNHDRTITKLERKKAKQDEEAEAAIEAEVQKRLAAALEAQQSVSDASESVDSSEPEPQEQPATEEAVIEETATKETATEKTESADINARTENRAEASEPTSMFAS